MAGTKIRLSQANSISLDMFKESVKSEHESPHGALRLSRSKEGLTRFGETVWERSRNTGTEQENRMVRVAFYNALKAKGVAHTTMQNIMSDLGITLSDDGKTATVDNSTPLERREIKRMISEAETYLKTRQYFFDELVNEGYNDKASIRQIEKLLGFSHAENCLISISDAEKQEIRKSLENWHSERLNKRFAEVNVTSGHEYTNVYLAKDEISQQIMSLVNGGKNIHEFNKVLSDLVKKCNEKILDFEQDFLSAKLDEKLQASNSPYCDCKTIKNALLTEIKSQMVKNPVVISSKEELGELFAATATTCLSTYNASDTQDFGPIVNLFSNFVEKQEPSMEDLAAFHGQLKQMADTILFNLKQSGYNVSADDSSALYAELFAKAKNAYQENDKEMPQASALTKSRLETFKSHLEYMKSDDMLLDDPLQNNENRAAILQEQSAAIDNLARLLGIDSLEPAQNINAEDWPKVFNFLKQEVDQNNTCLKINYTDSFKDDYLANLTMGLKIPVDVDFRDPKTYLAQTGKDLSRGCVLKLGDTCINTQKNYADNIMNYFDRDVQNGRKAAYVLGYILNQSISNSLVFTNTNRQLFFKAGTHFIDFSASFDVNRLNDGSYSIHVKTFNPIKASESANTNWTNSRVDFDFTLKLSFAENDEYKLEIEGPMKGNGEMHLSSFTKEDADFVTNLKDAQFENVGTYALYDSKITDSAQFKQFFKQALDGDDTQLADFLKKNSITGQDVERLTSLGIPSSPLQFMLKRCLPAENYPSKQLIQNMFSYIPTTRQHAVDTFSAMLRPYLDMFGINAEQLESSLHTKLEQKAQAKTLAEKVADCKDMIYEQAGLNNTPYGTTETVKDAFFQEVKGMMLKTLPSNPSQEELDAALTTAIGSCKDTFAKLSYPSLDSAVEEFGNLFNAQNIQLENIVSFNNKIQLAADEFLFTMKQSGYTLGENARSDLFANVLENVSAQYRAANADPIPETKLNSLKYQLERFKASLNSMMANPPAEGDPLAGNPDRMALLKEQSANVDAFASLMGITLDMNNVTAESLQSAGNDVVNSLKPQFNASGKPFNLTMSNSFTQVLSNMISSEYKENSTIENSMEQILLDLNRDEILQLGNEFIYDSTPQENAERIKAYFNQDEQHGTEALKILSNVMNQKMGAWLVTACTPNGILRSFARNYTLVNLQNYQVTRKNDGSYDVHVIYGSNMQGYINTLSLPSSDAPVNHPTDKSRSWDKWDFHLNLSFPENGSPKLAIDGPINVSGVVTNSSFLKDAQSFMELNNLQETGTNYFIGKYALFDSTMMNDEQLHNLMRDYMADRENSSKRTALETFLKTHAITQYDEERLVERLRKPNLSPEDEKHMKDLKMPESLVHSLLTKAIPGSTYPTRKLLNNLFHSDPDTRARAIADFKRIVTPYLELFGLKEDDINLA